MNIADMKAIESWSAADEPQLKARLEQRAEPVLIKGLVADWPAVKAGAVCELESAVPVKQLTVSHHLRLLREDGLIEAWS